MSTQPIRFDTVYNLAINERQRSLIHDLLAEFKDRIKAGQEVAFNWSEVEELLALEDMLNPRGNTGPLEPAPAVNGLIL